MSILKINKRKDFGTEYYVQILNIKRTSLLQVSVSWNDFPSWPYFQLRSGIGDVLSIVFWAGKLGIDITLLGRTWSWDFMKEIDEEEDV
jgi:hypothetical protein